MLDEEFIPLTPGPLDGMKFRKGPMTVVNGLDEDSLIPARTVVHFDIDESVLVEHELDTWAIEGCEYCKGLFD